VVVVEGGERIGILGATTQILEAISSPTGTEVRGFPTGPGANGEVDDMALLAAQLQPIIDEMRAEGINKIILQAHLQNISNEKLLATLLKGVDIILAAGSNTRLGDADDVAVAFPGHAADFADTYPLRVTDAEGGTTLIINTDNEYTYLGRLKVDFDAQGRIIVGNLDADAAINGAYASTAENVAAAWGTTTGNLATTAFAEGTKGGAVEKLTDAVGAVIAAKDGNVFGYTNVYLEGERAFVRSQETNLGSLSADANAFALREAAGLGLTDVVVSFKNGGGIRAQIGTLSPPLPDGTVDKLPPPANPAASKMEGGVSQLDIENSLRFDNKLMAFDTTAQGLKAILEHGVAAGTLQGRFPQIGGVAFSWDPDLPAGSRVSDIALLDGDGESVVALYDDGVLQAGVPARITVVTLNFLANGGDGYPDQGQWRELPLPARRWQLVRSGGRGAGLHRARHDRRQHARRHVAAGRAAGARRVPAHLPRDDRHRLQRGRHAGGAGRADPEPQLPCRHSAVQPGPRPRDPGEQPQVAAGRERIRRHARHRRPVRPR
jgi:2',3'-cyclic-nucleotide 2'-phosphodiesterase (5'-nucleotidase family)